MVGNYNIQNGSSSWKALGWYLFFGGLHELFHILAYISITKCMYDENIHYSKKQISDALLQGFLGRYSTFPSDTDPVILDASRHCGWIFSLVVAIALHLFDKHRCGSNARVVSKHDETVLPSPSPFLSTHTLSAYITAFEAICTDLLCIVPTAVMAPTATAITLFCGNFGIILINQSWITSDGGKTALDILEKMVNVTMMRGAQCGGVVTFIDKGQPKNGMPVLKGIRSRVVNGKRSDLSVGIRKQLQKDACNRFTGKLAGVPRGFYGHTRFATSSKATFDGCHPHQWTPPTTRIMYGPFGDDVALSSKASLKKHVIVENFITHNGDLDFYNVNGKNYDLGTIQEWLEVATGAPMPATVDSAAIAGLVDLLRTQGCFGLSARYAICFCLPTSRMEPSDRLPTYHVYETIGIYFENALDKMLTTKNSGGNNKDSHYTLEDISSSKEKRLELVEAVLASDLSTKYNKFKDANDLVKAGKESSSTHPFQNLFKFIDEEAGASLMKFVTVTVDAFFDNDLLNTTKTFLANAKGSFGIGITCSLDAYRQFCIGARGQPMSVAFYPKKGLVCYGSEQGAVKAGLSYDTPFPVDDQHSSKMFEEKGSGGESMRLDLDDLGGEICLLDWGTEFSDQPAISPPNRHLPVYKLMNGTVNCILLQESKAVTNNIHAIHSRMTPLEGNELIKPLRVNKPGEDLVLSDIQDIPKICRDIQDDWQDVGLNRLTAWNFSKCIEARMQAIVEERVPRHAGSIDILLTGCEVSLWLAEQFATDLQKAFPKLFIKAISSNKILGLLGQEISIPCTGYPMSTKTHDFSEPIVIIVSHSGGTFAPLACSNLLQSFTRSIFVVTSEWDTQIGKQLRGMYDKKDMISSRIFSTECGVRPAEPCSLTVVATQQLLTIIFIHTCMSIIGNIHHRHASGAVVNEYDLEVLERLNQDNILALEEIVGVAASGDLMAQDVFKTESELRNVGDIWAEHILENAKAYIMSFFYIFITVTSGYPLITGIATAAGLDTDWAFYITRFFDCMIYFWLPQINIIILRLVQGRNLRHRMVGRTIVIGDCPWVAQAAEAFLSKLFACSYSIAGCNVLSGNPADHLVHRHTHRVVRGSLLVCGRPDGRLSALTSLEATTCLSVNQASSIQSIGGTCESVTIGHNPYKLPLSFKGIFLEAYRPQFLCEKVLDHLDGKEENDSTAMNGPMLRLQRAANVSTRQMSSSLLGSRRKKLSTHLSLRRSRSRQSDDDDSSVASSIASSNHGRLLGIYSDLQSKKEVSDSGTDSPHDGTSVQSVIAEMIKEKAGVKKLRQLFDEMDADGGGTIDQEEFVTAFLKFDPSMDKETAIKIFLEADIDEGGDLNFDEFTKIAKMPHADMVSNIHIKNRCEKGLTVVHASQESYFGEETRKSAPATIKAFTLAKSQTFAMELFESRIASLQRFVAMTVMFHQIGKRVQEFFPRISFGLLGYRMDRTHSIMRIATTASPVSGADVRERMEALRVMKTINYSIAAISRAWLRYKKEKVESKAK